MSFFLKNWRQIELRATVLIVVENAPIFSLFGLAFWRHLA